MRLHPPRNLLHPILAVVRSPKEELQLQGCPLVNKTQNEIQKLQEVEMCGACIRSLHPLLHIITSELDSVAFEWKPTNCKNCGTLITSLTPLNTLLSLNQ